MLDQPILADLMRFELERGPGRAANFQIAALGVERKSLFHAFGEKARLQCALELPLLQIFWGEGFRKKTGILQEGGIDVQFLAFQQRLHFKGGKPHLIVKRAAGNVQLRPSKKGRLPIEGDFPF